MELELGKCLKTPPELLELLQKMNSLGVSPEERFQAKVSFVYGCLEFDTKISRENVEEILRVGL